MVETPVLSEDNSTQEQIDLANKQAKSIAALISRAIRLQANGQEFDAGQVRDQARQHYQSLLDMLPAERIVEQSIFSPIDLMASYWQSQAERRALAGTGFPTLDRALSGGLERDRLYVVLGAPGSGKTTLINQMCDHVGRERAVFYVTSENAPLDLLSKTIARRASIEYTAVSRGYASERDRINAAFAEYGEQAQARLIRYADASRAGMPLAEVASAAYEHFEATAGETKGDPVIVIDYLQRLARSEDRYVRQSAPGGLGNDSRQIATAYTERLRELACTLHCSVICLSAVSRASGYSANNNMLSSAKESGDIEYTADVIAGIGQDEPGGAPLTLPEPGAHAWLLRLDKNRQGEATLANDYICLTWYPRLQKFIERDTTASAGDQDAGQGNGRYNRRRK